MNRKNIFFLSWDLLIPAAVLLVLSLTTLLSINAVFFRSQIFFLGISILAFLFFSQVNYQILRLYAVPFYIAAIILLILILIIGIESRGAVRWVELFGFRIQFSEILKPFLAVSLSSFLANNQSYSAKTFFSIFCFLMPVVTLIFLQPDLGNALVYLGVALVILVTAGFPLRFFAFLTALAALAAPFFWMLLHDYQKQRLFTFLNPNDPLGSSYNAIQSIIAVGSGMFFGRGLGQGTQSQLRFLPERHTDFIFAAISEGLGFVGALLVLLAFSYLFYRIYFAYGKSTDRFQRFFYISAFSIFFVQFFMNVGMNIGLLPIVGITLPFLSYGGSSLLSNFILLGLLSSIGKRGNTHTVLEIK